MQVSLNINPNMRFYRQYNVFEILEKNGQKIFINKGTNNMGG